MDSTRDANRITEFFVGEDVSLTVLVLSLYNGCSSQVGTGDWGLGT